MGRRVLKFDGPLARGLWWRLTPQIIKKGRGSAFGHTFGVRVVAA